jgi:hypothetical protein
MKTKINFSDVSIEFSMKKEHAGIKFLEREIEDAIGGMVARYEYIFADKEEGRIKTGIKIEFTLGGSDE